MLRRAMFASIATRRSDSPAAGKHPGRLPSSV